MNPPILTSFGNPDPNASPLNITELIALMNTLVTSEITGSYIPYVLSADTPSVDDQDKAWIELDSSGRPLALKTFYTGPSGGNWRRVYNGMVGEVRGYTGDPSVDFDTDGLGLVGETYDGWHIMNGNGGTANLTDKFIIGAHMDDSGGHVGYDSGWQTFVDGTSDLSTGGTKDHTIVMDDLPALNNAAAGQNAGLWIHGKDWKDEDHTPDFFPLVSNHYANAVPNDQLLITYGNTGTQTPVPTLPPFYALAWITFVGYS